LVYAFKIAGAKADEKATIDEVTRIAQKTADRCRSVGMALTPCTIPQAGKPGFEISDDEMEMGMGIHGEPGVWRGKLKKADEIAQEMFDLILKDMPLEIDDTASVMVNSLGATPTEELYIVYRYIKTELDKLGVRIVMPLIGHYATSMEMAGMTLTICRLDNELERLIKAPCECAFWKVGTYE
jgi:Dihydroxyacetone kinase